MKILAEAYIKRVGAYKNPVADSDEKDSAYNALFSMSTAAFAGLFSLTAILFWTIYII